MQGSAIVFLDHSSMIMDSNASLIKMEQKIDRLAFCTLGMFIIGLPYLHLIPI